MSEFFDSPVVRAAMAEIQELQEDIMQGMIGVGLNPNTKEGHYHITKMRSLLDKQRNFMFRLALEKKDPQAIEMREQILKSAEFLGLKPGQDINQFFNLMDKTLDKLEAQLPKD